MMGVVVLCLIFLVLPGQVVNTNTTGSSTTKVTTTEAQTVAANTSTTTEVSKTEKSTTSDSVSSPNSEKSVPTSTADPTSPMNTNPTGSTTTEVQTIAANTSTTTEVSRTEKSTTSDSVSSPNSEKSVPTSAADPTSPKPEICSPGACGNSSTCLQLHKTYVCRCPLNYHYDAADRTCKREESFFGEFIISGVNFNSSPESSQYTELYDRVMKQSNVSLSGLPDYLGTNIVQISERPSKPASKSRRSATDVSARVTHMFRRGTATTGATVTQAIVKNLGTFGKYNSQSICDGFYCDPETTTCEATADDQAATCTCMDGKYSSSSLVTSCRDCSPECYKDESKYCNMESQTVPVCACRVGYKEKGDTCERCGFGYSGKNCADNYQLILVIVGAVLGVAVLALLGAVIGVSVSSKKGKKYGDRVALIDKDEATPAERSPAPTRLFPKVQAKTQLGQVNSGASAFDDNEEFSRNFPKRDYDENQWYEMDKKGRRY